MKIVILGTTATFPTKKRNHPAIYLKFRNEKFLFDCGEGTQRQLRIAGISITKITRVFITHWHGDHSLGLVGLITSLSMANRKAPLYVYGPLGTKERIEHLKKAFVFEPNIELKIKEVRKGEVCGDNYFSVHAFPVQHRVPCVNYYFKERDKRKINLNYLKKYGLKQHKLLGKLQKGKDIIWKGKKIKAEKATILIPGKKVTYITDTRYFKGLEEFAKNSDLLICESTYSEEIDAKAREYSHLIAPEAAKLAKKSGSKKLILTHFSQRYRDVTPLVEQAKKIFPKTRAARDFMKIEI